MKKILLSLLVASILGACSGVKVTNGTETTTININILNKISPESDKIKR